MKSRPITVGQYMTVCPHTIGHDQPLSRARQMMRQYGIRHLPVLDGGRLVGIVSSRDLDFVESLRDVDPEKLTVEEAMSQEPYTVSPHTPLEQVATTMADHRYGSAVVIEGNQVIGVFTTVDALRALADTLRSLSH